MLDDAKLSAVLGDFARTVITDFPIQGILDDLVKRIVTVLPITSAGVTLMSPGSAPRYVAASDDDALAYEKLQADLGEGPCTAAYELGEPVMIPDLRLDQRFPTFSKQAMAAGCAAVFTFPLRHNDGRLGALDLYRESPGEMSEHAIAAAQTLADVTAAYLLNATAREDARLTSDRFRRSALHDPLTGLPNRALLLQRLEHAAKRAQRSHAHSAVMYADLDRFKFVNDTYGHGTGDELLIAVARRLAGLVRPGDTLARVSGDEFVFLCEDVKSTAHIETFAERVCRAFDRPFLLPTTQLEISASVGIAFSGPGEALTEQLITNADIAMYQAKRNGGGVHQVIDLRQMNRAVDANRLVESFREAFSAEKLDLAYQPIVRSTDGSIIGVEALLRWTDPELGPIPTMAMVGIAEQYGLIDDVGAWVLRRACTDHHRWVVDNPGEDLGLAVNVSARQLLGPGFCAMVARVLDETGFEPSSLILEMNDSIYLADADRAMTVLEDLKAIGVRLALDNFGTGQASLKDLRRFPIDILKIDRSFTADIGQDPIGSALVSSLIQLAHGLGLRVTVEGVETRGQRDEVRTLAPDAAQGYFFARPMSASGIDALLATARATGRA